MLFLFVVGCLELGEQEFLFAKAKEMFQIVALQVGFIDVEQRQFLSYAFRGNVPERDGILAGLYMLDFMVKTGKKPTELLKDLFAKVGGEYFYDRVDSPFSGDHAARKKIIMDNNPKTLGGLKVTELVTVDGFQFRLEDGGWMLIRFSGTEPILRVYCETRHGDKVKEILEDGLRVAGVK